jgi:iron complex outermembrane receptor protein
VSAEVGAGSFETYTASAEGTLPVGAASIRMAASADATGGAFPYLWDPTPDDPDPTTVAATRLNNAAARAGGLVALRVPLRASTLDVVAHATAARRELPGWPYALTPDDRQDDARALLSARLSGPGPGRSLVLAASASARFDLLDTRTATTATHQRGVAAGADAEARWSHGPGLLRLAVEGREEVFEDAGLGERRARTALAASASEDLAAGERLRVSPAVRVERVGAFGGVSAKLGASVALGGPVALRASGGRSFRVPSFAELYLRQGIVTPNPDLVPEEGIGGDAALVLDTGAAFASVGGHATLYDHLIAYEPVSFGKLRPFNTGRALVRGLEVEVAAAPIRRAAGLALSASYTLLATEVLRGPEGTLGNWLPHRARHRLYARASVAPGPAGLHVEAHWVGRQYADARNLTEIPAALVWNAGASLLLSRRHALRVHLEVRNVLDDRTLQDALGNPLPGRTVLASLRAGTPEAQGTP